MMFLDIVLFRCEAAVTAITVPWMYLFSQTQSAKDEFVKSFSSCRYFLYPVFGVVLDFVFSVSESN